MDQHTRKKPSNFSKVSYKLLWSVCKALQNINNTFFRILLVLYQTKKNSRIHFKSRQLFSIKKVSNRTNFVFKVRKTSDFSSAFLQHHIRSGERHQQVRCFDIIYTKFTKNHSLHKIFYSNEIFPQTLFLIQNQPNKEFLHLTSWYRFQ